jgi:Mor family transcriptional regulator
MKPDAELVFWNIFNICHNLEGLDEEQSHRIALGFLKAYGGSFIYIPKSDEFDRSTRNKTIKKLLDMGTPPYLIAPHFGITAQCVIDIGCGKYEKPLHSELQGDLL